MNWSTSKYKDSNFHTKPNSCKRSSMTAGRDSSNNNLSRLSSNNHKMTDPRFDLEKLAPTAKTEVGPFS